MAFWKPGEKGPGMGVERDQEKEKEGQFAVWNPNAQLSITQQRMRLPVFQNRSQILYLIEKYATVVLVGQTGCGKTTQIPQYLHEGGWTAGGRVVVCTQPRRVAATSVAARVADETGTVLGQEVGYSVRFDGMTSSATRLKFVTDGLLVREMMMDPLLSAYSVVILDEAHERSLHTDILIGLLKKVQRKRKDLRLVVSSATLDAEEMKDFFETNTTNDPKLDTAAIISIEGRTFPVDIHYLQTPCSDYLTTALTTVVDIHNTQPEGDILVFLTGQEEIDTLVQLVKDKAAELMESSNYKGMKLKPVPIYSGLPQELQMKVFAPPKRKVRKVVIATNIAETSITIDGIVYVVDCGFVKIRTYSGRTGLESLVVVPSSQASCNQRAGRAGRNRPGKCYRLFTEAAFESLSKQTVPEIQRTNLAPVVLQLKALGIDDVLHFDFISAPPARVMVRALELLYALGALDETCKLTPVGIKLAEFPVEPAFAKMIFAAATYGCMEDAISVAAMLSLQTVFLYPKDAKNQADQVRLKFAVHEGDHLTLLNVYNGFIASGQSGSWCHERFIHYKSLSRAVEIRRQLAAYVKKFKLVDKSAPIAVKPTDPEDTTEGIRKAIVSGFFANAAHLQSDGSYITIKDRHKLYLHPTSVVFRHPPEWVVFHEVMLTTKEYMRDVTAINPTWLSEIAQRPVVTQKDFDLYCHYVAGLVGIGLSQLFAVSGLESEWFATAEDVSNSMGLFLQKTNISRDYLEDITQVPPRIFWPKDIWSKYSEKLDNFLKPEYAPKALACLNDMITGALVHVPAALEYLGRLTDKKVFTFCAIPQVMAIATLALCYNNYNVFTGVVKIRRGQTAKIMNDIYERGLQAVYEHFYNFANDIGQKIDPSDPNAAKTTQLVNEIKKVCGPHVRASAGFGVGDVVAVAAIAASSAYLVTRHNARIFAKL